MKSLGEFIREKRVIDLKQSLRSFCIANKIDAGNWSKVERDMRDPPAIESLRSLLKIEKGTDDAAVLDDLYNAHQIVKHLTDDEVAQRLPIALRATRMLSDAQLEQLKEELKES